MITKTELKQMALLGYQEQLRRIDAQIADVQLRLQTADIQQRRKTLAPKKHRISPEGRARIAAAQRRRWAAAKKLAAGA